MGSLPPTGSRPVRACSAIWARSCSNGAVAESGSRAIFRFTYPILPQPAKMAGAARPSPVACPAMTVIVRDARPEDLPRVVEVRRAVLPFLVETPESLHAQVRNAPRARRHRLLVAERDGRSSGRRTRASPTTAPSPAGRPPRRWCTRRTGDGARAVCCCGWRRTTWPRRAPRSCTPGCWTSRSTGRSPSGAATAGAARRASSGSTWRGPTCRSRRRSCRRVSRWALRRTSRPTRAAVRGGRGGDGGRTVGRARGVRRLRGVAAAHVAQSASGPRAVHRGRGRRPGRGLHRRPHRRAGALPVGDDRHTAGVPRRGWRSW